MDALIFALAILVTPFAYFAAVMALVDAWKRRPRDVTRMSDRKRYAVYRARSGREDTC